MIIDVRYSLYIRIPLECARLHNGIRRNLRLAQEVSTSPRRAPLGTDAGLARELDCLEQGSGVMVSLSTDLAIPVTAPDPRSYCFHRSTVLPPSPPACSAAAATATMVIPDPSHTQHCHSTLLRSQTHAQNTRLRRNYYDEIDMICNKTETLILLKKSSNPELFRQFSNKQRTLK